MKTLNILEITVMIGMLGILGCSNTQVKITNRTGQTITNGAANLYSSERVTPEEISTRTIDLAGLQDGQSSVTVKDLGKSKTSASVDWDTVKVVAFGDAGLVMTNSTTLTRKKLNNVMINADKTLSIQIE